MAGVRIQHDRLRSVTLTLVDGARPYREALVCRALMVIRGELRPCARTHVVKTYHLNLDESGSTIVSDTIWDRLQRIPGNPFQVANAVAEPPPQTIHVPRIRILPSAVAPGV